MKQEKTNLECLHIMVHNTVVGAANAKGLLKHQQRQENLTPCPAKLIARSRDTAQEKKITAEDTALEKQINSVTCSIVRFIQL